MRRKRQRFPVAEQDNCLTMASGKKRLRLTFSAEEMADLCIKTISKDESKSESDPSGMLSEVVRMRSALMEIT